MQKGREGAGFTFLLIWFVTQCDVMFLVNIYFNPPPPDNLMFYPKTSKSPTKSRVSEMLFLHQRPLNTTRLAASYGTTVFCWRKNVILFQVGGVKY